MSSARSSSFLQESYSSSVDHPAYIAWQTLSSEISANLKHGSVRISRHNVLEYATIQEEANNENIPLIGGDRHKRHSSHVESLAIQTGSTWPTCAFLLVNTALGAGLLNYPYAYDKAGGILCASILQLVMIVILAITMIALAYCAEVNNDNTYHDVLLSMVGRRAQQASAATILATCFGVCVTFLIIIGDQYDRFFLSVVGENFADFWYIERRFTISITAFITILPMCYFRRLDFLRYASTLGIFAMIYPVFLTIYKYYTLDIIPGEIKTSPTSTLQMLTVIPIICFAYQTHEIVVPVYACMRNRNVRDFKKVVFITMFILMITYFLTGTFGYLTFGSNIVADIMQQYDAKDPLVLIGIIALVIKMVTTYPPLVLCGRGAIEGLYAEFTGQSTSDFIKSEKTRRMWITTIWFFLTLLFAVFIPNISIVIEVLGCVAALNIFVFPGLCMYYLIKRMYPVDKPLSAKGLSLISILMIVFGLFIFVVVFVEVANTLFTATIGNSTLAFESHSPSSPSVVFHHLFGNRTI